MTNDDTEDDEKQRVLEYAKRHDVSIRVAYSRVVAEVKITNL